MITARMEIKGFRNRIKVALFVLLFGSVDMKVKIKDELI